MHDTAAEPWLINNYSKKRQNSLQTIIQYPIIQLEQGCLPSYFISSYHQET